MSLSRYMLLGDSELKLHQEIAIKLDLDFLQYVCLSCAWERGSETVHPTSQRLRSKLKKIWNLPIHGKLTNTTHTSVLRLDASLWSGYIITRTGDESDCKSLVPRIRILGIPARVYGSIKVFFQF